MNFGMTIFSLFPYFCCHQFLDVGRVWTAINTAPERLNLILTSSAPNAKANTLPP